MKTKAVVVNEILTVHYASMQARSVDYLGEVEFSKEPAESDWLLARETLRAALGHDVGFHDLTPGKGEVLFAVFANRADYDADYRDPWEQAS